jgi:hypothetical protein
MKLRFAVAVSVSIFCLIVLSSMTVTSTAHITPLPTTDTTVAQSPLATPAPYVDPFYVEHPEVHRFLF